MPVGHRLQLRWAVACWSLLTLLFMCAVICAMWSTRLPSVACAHVNCHVIEGLHCGSLLCHLLTVAHWRTRFCLPAATPVDRTARALIVLRPTASFILSYLEARDIPKLDNSGLWREKACEMKWKTCSAVQACGGVVHEYVLWELRFCNNNACLFHLLHWENSLSKQYNKIV